MDKITSDTLFKINQMFNFVEPINNPVELTIGDTLNKLDDENIEGIYNEVTGRTSCGVSFYEFVDSPNDFPRILGLFDDNMQEKLLLYAEAVEHVDSISIFDNEYDNPHCFMSVYEWLDDGSMKWIDAFGSEKLENMSCLKQN